MSRAWDNSSKGSVRFAEEQQAASPHRPCALAASTAGAPAATPQRLDVKLGFLLAGGLYATDLLLLEPTSGCNNQPVQQPHARNLATPNLSVGVEPVAGGQAQRVVLRLWAEREGPFAADFTLVLSPHQEVQVHVSATAFSRRKGSPALKPHVRCLGFSGDPDTEAASDWAGFS